MGSLTPERTIALDPCLATLVHRDWLMNSALADAAPAYSAALRGLRYNERTIRSYLGGLAHFSYWLQSESGGCTRPIAASTVDRFLHQHLPSCHSSVPRYATAATAGAALRPLGKRLQEQDRPVPASAADPLAAELQRFAACLARTRGLAPSTCHQRIDHLGGFLTPRDVVPGPVLPRLTVARLDAFIEGQCQHGLARYAPYAAACEAIFVTGSCVGTTTQVGP